MNNLAAFLEGLGRVSLQGAALVLLVLLAQRLLGRQLAPRWRCALWLVVMARLVLPVSVSSVVSVFNMVPRLEPKKVVIPASFKRVESALDESGLTEVNRIEPHSNPGPMPDFQARPKSPGEVSASRMVPWPVVVLALWLAGMGALASYIAICSWRMTRRFSSLSSITDPGLLALLEQCRRAHGLRDRLLLVESPDVSTPALYGFFRPKLLLPSGFAARFSASEMRFILLHEIAHVKRRDIAFNWLATCLQIFHWFNPLIWVGFSRWRADRELACDAMALDAAGPEQNREYGRTILRLLEGFTPRAAVPGLVGILEDKRQLRRRIAMIAEYVPGRKWQMLALALVAALAITGLTDAQNKSSEPEKPKETKVQPPSRPVVANGPAMKVTVLDAQTGQPVPDAEVLAPNQAAFFGWEQNPPRWTTDKSGLATIHLGEPGPGHLEQQPWFTLSVRHQGYAPRGFSWSTENKDIRPSMPGELTVRLERGLTAGGVVRDEQGAPIAGVLVKAYGSTYWSGLRHEYSEYWNYSPDAPPMKTDAQGRWELKDFPRDLEFVCIKLSWPGGSDQQFTTSPIDSGANPFQAQNPGAPLSLEDLRAGKLELVLKRGTTVQGLVLDPAGKPLAGVPVKAGFGLANVTRLKETRTDAAGKFEFSHFLHRQLIVTACPDDYAVTSMIIDMNSNTMPVRLQVAPLQPLRMRVDDGLGRPLAGAKIWVDEYRSEGQLLDFSTETDHDGVAVWSNAPISSFAMMAHSPVVGAGQKIRLTPDQREITFKLRAGMDKEVIVTAKAHDVETGAALALDSIKFQTADREGFSGENEAAGLALRLVIAETRFRPEGTYPEFQLEVKAKGYATLIAPWRDFDEGDWSPDFALEPAHRAGRVVLLPDGSPAARARVWSHFEQGEKLFINRPGQYYGDRLAQTRADDTGSFELPGGADDETVLFTHAGGFLQTTVGEIKRHLAVRLQAFGRVQGILEIAGQPRQGVSVGLSSLYWSQTAGFNLMYLATTAADGSFDFSDVPAGDYKVYRYRSRGNGPINEDHPMPLTVKAGETTKVQYSNSGRRVIGQAVPENPDLAVDWQNDDHTLTLKQKPLPVVDLNDFANAKDFAAARDHASESPEQLRQLRQANTCVLDFDQDGSFHVDDVPPGTYQLRINVTKPGANRFRGPFPNPDDDLGFLEREVVVPPGNGPFDLGKLTVKIKDTDGSVKKAVADFNGRALDGRAISLAQYRGKYLVLTFWATWSDRSTEQLENVRKLEEQLSRDGRIAFLGVSLDEDAKTVRQTVETRGYKWTQAELDSATLAKAAGNFDVSSLPAIYLLDRQGRVVASNLEGDRLRASVQRALKN